MRRDVEDHLGAVNTSDGIKLYGLNHRHRKVRTAYRWESLVLESTAGKHSCSWTSTEYLPAGSAVKKVILWYLRLRREECAVPRTSPPVIGPRTISEP